MSLTTQHCASRDLSTRVKRETYTPLGLIFYKHAFPWQRLKIETELFDELGIKKHSLRAYMVSTPAHRMKADMKAIILRTLPEAKQCFTGSARLKKTATL